MSKKLFQAWPTIDTALFFALSRLKIDGVHLMGIDRRKIENRYKSGNKPLTTWSFNLGFLYVHHQCSTGHRVKFQLFWIGILFFRTNFEIYYK